MSSPPSEKRPSPEALLRQAKREERGQLKIFLGAAPGVGKTYAMLSEGAMLKREGEDVVVAVVETHGRAETERCSTVWRSCRAAKSNIAATG